VTAKAAKDNLSAAATSGADMDRWGTAEVLPIEAIHIDPDYQRDLRHDLINKIAREYDLVKAGPILVSERADGTLMCVDGQHRMLGAAQAGETEVFANVVHGLTQEQEAALRLARNDRRADTIYEKFRTRLVMGDEKAHRIVEIVRQQGSDVNLVPTQGTGINGIATLELLYDVDGTGAWLGRALRVINEAFGADRMGPETCSASMMKAVTWFLSQHVDSHEVPLPAFIERLGSHGPEDIRRKAVSHKAANGGAEWINHYRAMVELWNFRRQEKSMIRWKTIGSISQLGVRGGRTDGWEHHRDRAGGGSSGGGATGRFS
jgi:hypothetical protein